MWILIILFKILTLQIKKIKTNKKYPKSKDVRFCIHKVLHRPKQRAATANYYIIWVNINTTNSLACFVEEPVSLGLDIKYAFNFHHVGQITKLVSSQDILKYTNAPMAPPVEKSFLKEGWLISTGRLL